MTKAPHVSTEAPLLRFWVIDTEVVGEIIPRSAEERLEEAVSLTQALSLIEVVGTTLVKLQRVKPSTYMGKGKVEEIAELIAENKIDVVMVNAKLSPSQQRNLELAWSCKVIDRTALILEIFGERARTKAGRLQVELAQLTYQQSRLVRSWTHLERQRGGLGKTGGPGERQIELDRRMIRDRITLLKRDLKAISKERELQRQKRDKSGMPKVSLVGYTNAGKSTLFNALTHADTMAKDQLFATLDPLMRRMDLPGGLEIVLVDTVGFVSDLPHELVSAFEATLEEVRQSDLILHVADGASSQAKAQIQDVNDVLKNIGATDVPVMMVFNKADLAEGRKAGEGHWISALEESGVEELLKDIEKQLQLNTNIVELQLSVSAGKELAWLYEHGDVLEKELEEDHWVLKVKLGESEEARFKKMCDMS